MRGQANLAGLAVALVLLTAATVVGVVTADAALADADGDPLERRAASAVADRLVSADSPVTVGANAMAAGAVDDLTADRLDDLAPPAAGRDVRIALDGSPVVERGSPDRGVTVRRSVVVVSRRGPAAASANLSRGESVRIPRGVDRATIRFEPGPNTTVRTVSADGRVVLHDERGLDESTTIFVSRYRPTRLHVSTDTNATGRVDVSYRRRHATGRTLTVTVDA